VKNGKDISILINGFERKEKQREKPHKFEDRDVYESVVSNTYPMTMVTRYLGADMKAREG